MYRNLNLISLNQSKNDSIYTGIKILYIQNNLIITDFYKKYNDIFLLIYNSTHLSFLTTQEAKAPA